MISSTTKVCRNRRHGINVGPLTPCTTIPNPNSKPNPKPIPNPSQYIKSRDVSISHHPLSPALPHPTLAHGRFICAKIAIFCTQLAVWRWGWACPWPPVLQAPPGLRHRGRSPGVPHCAHFRLPCRPDGVPRGLPHSPGAVMLLSVCAGRFLRLHQLQSYWWRPDVLRNNDSLAEGD